MSVNYSLMILLPNYDMFARPVTFYPYKSRPGSEPYNARGIFETYALDLVGEDNSIISDQRTILDIREVEFSVLPIQGDRVVIGADGEIPAVGEFEILDSDTNGGGETTLALRRWLPPVPRR